MNCDHNWELIDASFDHEYGVEQILFYRCTLCDKEKEFPSIFDSVKNAFSKKLTKFALCEIILFTGFWVTYNFLLQDMGIMIMGFCTLSAAVVLFFGQQSK